VVFVDEPPSIVDHLGRDACWRSHVEPQKDPPGAVDAPSRRSEADPLAVWSAELVKGDVAA
jgi:hypothetical protein